MRTKNIISLLALIFVIGQGYAQMNIKWRGSDDWGIGSRFEQLYNNYNLQSYSGQISRIDTVTPMMEMASGIQITLKTDREDLNVILGPAWFIIHQDMNLTLNDYVDVKGNRVAIKGKQVIIAAEVKRKEHTLFLRDKDGIPYWCSWRKE